MLPAVRWDDKSCAEFWEEFSEAVVAADNLAGQAATITRTQESPGACEHPAIEFCFDYFFGDAAGLAASFFAPLAAFTSTSVADMV